MSVHSYRILKSLSPDAFSLAAELCEKFVDRQERSDLAGWDGTGEPVFSQTLISFNGVMGDGHQTFQIRLDGSGSTSCDTNHQNYDFVVRACLLILSDVLGDAIDVSIDDNHPQSTELARALVEAYVGTMV